MTPTNQLPPDQSPPRVGLTSKLTRLLVTELKAGESVVMTPLGISRGLNGRFDVTTGLVTGVSRDKKGSTFGAISTRQRNVTTWVSGNGRLKHEANFKGS